MVIISIITTEDFSSAGFCMCSRAVEGWQPCCQHASSLRRLLFKFFLRSCWFSGCFSLTLLYMYFSTTCVKSVLVFGNRPALPHTPPRFSVFPQSADDSAQLCATWRTSREATSQGQLCRNRLMAEHSSILPFSTITFPAIWEALQMKVVFSSIWYLRNLSLYPRKSSESTWVLSLNFWSAVFPVTLVLTTISLPPLDMENS